MEHILISLYAVTKTIVLFSLVIGFVAFIHELGHFLAAKLCDVRVDAFAIGMGKKLLSVQRGETEYSLRLLPVGGYVLLAQEDGEDGSEDAGERSFARKTLVQKIFILLAGPFMNVVGTVAILLFVLGGLGQPATSMQVSMVQESSPAQRAGILPGDVFLAVGDQEIRRFQDGRTAIAGYAGKEVSIRVRRGSAFEPVGQDNVSPLWFQNNFYDGNVLEVSLVDRESKTYLDRKEQVLSLLKSEDLSRLRLRYSKSSEEMNFLVSPSTSGTIGIGIRPYLLDGSIVVLPLVLAFKESLSTTWDMSVQLLEQLGSMILNLVQKFQAPKDLGGPVAIASAVSEYAEDGIRSFLMLAAQICLCIGVFNLVPIPGLDGGRILVLVIKDFVNGFGRIVLKRAGDTFHDAFEGWINVFGVFCVFTLVILVTIKDIGDLIR
jgi:RIP metalloprotease RseP